MGKSIEERSRTEVSGTPPKPLVRRAVPAVDTLVRRGVTATVVETSPIDDMTLARDAYGSIFEELNSGRFTFDGKGISVKAIAASIGIRVQTLSDWRREGTKRMHLGKVYSGLAKYMDEEDDRMRVLKDIALRRGELSEDGKVIEGNEREDQIDIEKRKWLWKIRHEKISSGQIALLLRLSQEEPRGTFARKCQLSPSNLIAIENGANKNSLPSTLNFLINGANFEKNYREAAQSWRLEAAHREAMDIRSVDGMTFGKLIEYFRIQRGMTLDDVGKLAHNKTGAWVRKIERDNYKELGEENISALFDSLAIPTDLFTFMKQKARREKVEVSSDIREALLNEYFFIDPSEEVTCPFSKEDEELSEELLRQGTFGAALRFLRNRVRRSQKDLGHGNSGQVQIYKEEGGQIAPEDYTVARLAKELGLSILDRSTEVLLFLAKLAREGHQRGNFTAKTSSSQE